MIYKVVTRKSWDGRGNRNTFTNTYYRQSSTPLVSADWATAIAALVSAEKNCSINTVNFMDARVICHMNDDHTLADGEFRSFVQSGVGARAVVTNALDRDNCLLVQRQTATGNAGRLEYRGMLLEEDVATAPNGSLTLESAAAGNAMYSFNTFMVSALNSFAVAGAWVIPRPPAKHSLSARAVTGFVPVAVRKRQISTHRESLESARARLVQRELNALAEKARRFQRQVALGLVSLAQVVSTLQSYWDTGHAAFQALPILLRGLVKLPAFFGKARPALTA